MPVQPRVFHIGRRLDAGTIRLLNDLLILFAGDHGAGARRVAEGSNRAVDARFCLFGFAIQYSLLVLHRL